jgi:hypothetical protein
MPEPHKYDDEEIVEVLRLVRYRGPRFWVEDQLNRSIHGTRVMENPKGATIDAVTIGDFPTILREQS